MNHGRIPKWVAFKSISRHFYPEMHGTVSTMKTRRLLFCAVALLVLYAISYLLVSREGFYEPVAYGLLQGRDGNPSGRTESWQRMRSAFACTFRTLRRTFSFFIASFPSADGAEEAQTMGFGWARKNLTVCCNRNTLVP